MAAHIARITLAIAFPVLCIASARSKMPFDYDIAGALAAIPSAVERAITCVTCACDTVFSPSGELKQVQYATIAARFVCFIAASQLVSMLICIGACVCIWGRKGNPVLCARNDKRCLVWIPRDPVESLYDTSHGPSFRKLQRIDSHAFAAFSGIAADGRVLVQHLREACQQYRYVHKLYRICHGFLA